MRDIVQQTFLAADQLLHALGHVIEIAPEIGQLISPFAHTRADPNIQLAIGRLGKTLTQATNGLGKIPGQSGSRRQTGQAAGDHRPKRNMQPWSPRRTKLTWKVIIEVDPNYYRP